MQNKIKAKNYTEYFETYKINKTLSLQGHSRAGFQTSFLIKPYNFLLDFGMYTHKTINLGFLTHQHSDHCQRLPLVVTRDPTRNKKIYMPTSAINSVTKYYRATCELNYPEMESMSNEEFFQSINTQFIPVEPGLIITEDGLNNNCSNIHIPFQIEILKAYHNVDSVGYGFSENKSVLKKEITDQMSTDNKSNALLMKSLKTQKINTHEIQQIPCFVFFCDSQFFNLSKHDEWKKYPVVICECTGLISTSQDEDIHSKRYHTCITQLLPIMKEFIDKKWILIHVSMSLSVDEIIAAEKNLQDEGLNISIVYDKR